MRLSKVLYLLFFLLLSVGNLHAQILQPASWSYEISEKEYTVGDELELIFNVSIENDWYLYSSDFSRDCGPMVTTFVFEENDTYELVGDIVPIDPKEKYDDIFECNYTYFREHAQFRQKIKILEENPEIEGIYEYQVCTDVDGRCIPFDDEFTLADFTGSGGSKKKSRN